MVDAGKKSSVDDALQEEKNIEI